MPARDIIAKDFWLKAFSLVLAIMVWLAIRSNIGTDSTTAQNPFRSPDNSLFARPIMLLTPAHDHQAYVVEPPTVEVKVKAETEALKKLNPNDVQVFVRLTDVPTVPGAFPVEVKLPKNIALQQVSPSHVHVEPAKTRERNEE